MSSQLAVKAQPRTERGKERASALRRSGSIPAVIYGAHKETREIAFNAREFESVRSRTHGEKVLIDITYDDGSSDKAFIQEVQRDPVTRTILHADLLRVSLTEVMTLQVPVVAVGIADGVKNEGGTLEQVSRKITIKCLPTKVPPHIDVDVSALKVGQSLHVFDLPAIEGILFVDPKAVLFGVAAKVAEEALQAQTAAPTAPEVLKKKEGEAAVEGAPAAGAKAAAPAAKEEKKK